MIWVGQMRTIRAMLALALALAGGGSFAQSVTVQDSAFQRFLINTTGVGQQTISFTGSGQPVPSITGHSLAGDGSPGVRASATGVLRNQAGGSIPVSLAGRVTPAVVASFIGRALPLTGALLLTSDIYNFVQEKGYTVTPAANGFTVTKSAGVPAGCGFPPSGSQARQIIDNSGNTAINCGGLPGGITVTGYLVESTLCRVQWRCIQNGLSGAEPWAKNSSVPPSSPSSLAALQADIADDPGYPVSSSVARAINQARQLLNEPLPLASPQITGPSSSPGTTSTTTKSDGSTVTITQTFNHTYNGPNISTTTTTTTSTVPAGGGPVQTETTVQTPDPVQQEPEPFTMPCGVPGAPPCAVKVDETGVPTTVEDLADPQQRVDDTLQPLADLQADPIGFWPELPELTWNFALPTNCDVIPVPVFEEWMPPIDLCQFQPMFHSLMSVVWVLGGLFGAISLFWRNTLSTV